MVRASEKPTSLKYKRSGGVRQVRLNHPRELPQLLALNPRNWMAISCPAQGHVMDDLSLAAMDTDSDARLRVRELRGTIQWLMDTLSELESLEAGSCEIQLNQVRQDTEEGSAIRFSILHLLRLLGSEKKYLTLQELEQGRTIMETVPMKGNGILDDRATENPLLKQLILTIISTIGGVSHQQDAPGVTRETVQAFYEACEAFAKWYEEGYSESAHQSLFFLGASTEAAMEALEAVEEKVNEWFQLCEINAYAPDLVQGNLQTVTLAERPLAPIGEVPRLPLKGPFNPAWEERVQAWRERTLVPALGSLPDSISKEDWRQLLDRFKPYRTWKVNQTGSRVSSLGIEGVRKWLNNQQAKSELLALISADLDLRDEIDGVAKVERLMLLKRDFWEFIHNFVNFDRFYDLKDQAIFQVGILYMDGRSFHLCVPVLDQKKHTTMAAKSGLYLIYCQLSRQNKPTGPLIAAAVTNGESARLMVGKHGVFYDRENEEWDARIVQIIEHPINLRQAIMEPFRRLGNLLVSHMEKLSSSREKSMQTEIVSNVTELESTVYTPQAMTRAPSQPQQPSGGVGGFMAGGGLAIAAVTSSLAFLSSTMARINPFYFLWAFLSLIALILIPTTIVVWIRLRKRDIGLLLEAGGWAINAPMRLTRALGARLTLMARRR